MTEEQKDAIVKAAADAYRNRYHGYETSELNRALKEAGVRPLVPTKIVISFETECTSNYHAAILQSMSAQLRALVIKGVDDVGGCTVERLEMRIE